MEVSGQPHAPAALLPRKKSSWYQLDRRLGGPQSQSERGGAKKSLHPLSELEPPDHSAAIICVVSYILHNLCNVVYFSYVLSNRVNPSKGLKNLNFWRLYFCYIPVIAFSCLMTIFCHWKQFQLLNLMITRIITSNSIYQSSGYND
jgi:hypothetical protein